LYIHIGEADLTKIGKGTSRGKTYKIQKVFIHPKYTKEVAYYDIGIIQTAHIEFGTYAQPICIPGAPDLPDDDIDDLAHHAMDIMGEEPIRNRGNKHRGSVHCACVMTICKAKKIHMYGVGDC
jgi:hypothetical protein